MKLEICPNCNYALLQRTTYCPFCGVQLTHPVWKKVAAWILLILIGYGLVRCHASLIGGFNAPSARSRSGEPAR